MLANSGAQLLARELAAVLQTEGAELFAGKLAEIIKNSLLASGNYLSDPSITFWRPTQKSGHAPTVGPNP